MIIKNQNICEASDLVKFGENNGYPNAYTLLMDLIYQHDLKINVKLSISDYFRDTKDYHAKKCDKLIKEFCIHHELSGELIVCREIVEH